MEKILHVVIKGSKKINYIVKEECFIVHNSHDVHYWLWNLTELGGHKVLKYWVTESE